MQTPYIIVYPMRENPREPQASPFFGVLYVHVCFRFICQKPHLCCIQTLYSNPMSLIYGAIKVRGLIGPNVADHSYTVMKLYGLCMIS